MPTLRRACATTFRRPQLYSMGCEPRRRAIGAGSSSSIAQRLGITFHSFVGSLYELALQWLGPAASAAPGGNDNKLAFLATGNTFLLCVAHGNVSGSLSRPVRSCSI